MQLCRTVPLSLLIFTAVTAHLSLAVLSCVASARYLLHFSLQFAIKPNGISALITSSRLLTSIASYCSRVIAGILFITRLFFLGPIAANLLIGDLFLYSERFVQPLPIKPEVTSFFN
jgi:hypothetical protein